MKLLIQLIITCWLLEPYGFSGIFLQLIRSYLKNQTQIINVNSTFSEWETIHTGVSQGLILGHFLVKIFLNVLFLFVTQSHVSNYADDNTLY